MKFWPKRTKYSALIIGFVLFITTAPLLVPFIRDGYFASHDGEWAVIRLVEMHREIKDLQFPPRWAGFLNHGFGYPLFLFTYPFPYYVGEILHLLGFGFVTSIELVFMFGIMASAVAMFLLARRWWGGAGGIIAAIAYTWAPIRLVDLFVRGSIGESLGFVLFPLLFLFGEDVVRKTSGSSVVLFAAVFGMLLITHNVFALLFTPIIAGYLVWLLATSSGNRQKQLMATVGAGALGAGLSAYFWLPALVEKQHTLLASGILRNLANKFVPLTQLFAASTPNTQLPVYIGIVHIVGFVLAAAVVYTQPSLRKMRKKFGFLSVTVLAVVILATPIAAVFWQSVPLFSSVDFVWRMLGPLAFVLSLGLGALGTLTLGTVIVPILLIILIALSGSRLFPQQIIDRGDAFYETNDATTTVFDELMPVWVQEKPTNFYEQKVVVATGSGVIKDTHVQSDLVLFRTDLTEQSTVEINGIYFPGWQAVVDGDALPINIHPVRGTMLLLLPAGEHGVTMRFNNTPVRTIGNIISVVSIGLAIGITRLSHMHNKKKYS